MVSRCGIDGAADTSGPCIFLDGGTGLANAFVMNPRPILLLSTSMIAAVMFWAVPARAAVTNYVADMDISQVSQDWGQPHANLSVDGHALSIGGQKFARGLGTHAASEVIIEVGGRAESFSAQVGVDDEVGRGKGTVTFSVMTDDGRVLWQSQVLHAGEAPVAVNVSLGGARQIVLSADAEDITCAHADWAEAAIVMNEGTARIIGSIPEEPVILTPKAGPKPRLNGASVVGVRPGHDLLYTIAATGDRPMKFSATHLPKGLHLEAATGIITGRLADKGTHVVTVRAKNAAGKATRKLTVICGDQIGLTPAMGWNSWNCFASAVSAEKVKAAADAMVASSLINHGWTYINIDD